MLILAGAHGKPMPTDRLLSLHRREKPMKYLTPEQMAKPRKRRLLKKLRLGEFQEFGFSLEVNYSGDLDDVLDQWIAFVGSEG
ncbi:50S ribosome-binding protein YggL [Pseudomonas nicosulfuronedens]